MTLLFILLYSAALATLGLFISRRVKHSGDFFVAGRQLSSGLLFATFLAANLGAGTTVGAAGIGYSRGLGGWWWVGSAGIGSLLLAFSVGPRIRRIAAEHDLFTVGDYLEMRYSRAVRLLMAGILWIGSLAILAGQFIAMGMVLNVVTGLPAAWGSLLGAAIVIVYFSAGGLLSTVWVNLVQVIVKTFGFCLAVPWALSSIGGWSVLKETVTQHVSPRSESYFSLWGIGIEGILGYAVILVPSFIISPGLIQKLYGARDERTVRHAVGWQGLVLLLYSFLPVTLGMVAFVSFPELANPDLALPTLLAEGLPAWLGGIMLAAIFSAEVSSADAVLFMLSTSVARDFVHSVVRRDLDDASLLRLTRWTAAVSGSLGVAVAVGLQSIIVALTIFYSLLAVSLFVPLLGGLYWKRPTAHTALITMAASVAAALLIHVFTEGRGWGILTPAALGILLSALVFLFLSARDRRP